LQLEFEPADGERFPALALGHDVARAGGTSGAVLNAANEAAVEAFLGGELHFTEIVPACRSVLDSHNFDSEPSLDELIEIDRWARQEIARWALGVCVTSKKVSGFRCQRIISHLTPVIRSE
jgi:1-deoxy-D-xylulose-5-phosphate reductoisomerase